MENIAIAKNYLRSGDGEVFGRCADLLVSIAEQEMASQHLIFMTVDRAASARRRQVRKNMVRNKTAPIADPGRCRRKRWQ